MGVPDLLTVKAHAKINWSLNIVSVREDGYHELDMLMQSLELADELTFTPARWLSLSIDGRQLPVGGRNLVIRAANALNEYMGKRRGARISLKKCIPVRAGLGGGSADCAATLAALNRLWDLRLPEETLKQIGAGLGADVPFCLQGGLARVRGIGERLEALPQARRFPLVLLHPGQGLSTAQVFQKWDETGERGLPADMERLQTALLAGDLAGMDAAAGNALEKPAIAMLPEVAAAMRQLREAGAQMVRMTGSGSAVFGVFAGDEAARAAAQQLPGAIYTHTQGT